MKIEDKQHSRRNPDARPDFHPEFHSQPSGASSRAGSNRIRRERSIQIELRVSLRGPLDFSAESSRRADPKSNGGQERSSAVAAPVRPREHRRPTLGAPFNPVEDRESQHTNSQRTKPSPGELGPSGALESSRDPVGNGFLALQRAAERASRALGRRKIQGLVLGPVKSKRLGNASAARLIRPHPEPAPIPRTPRAAGPSRSFAGSSWPLVLRSTGRPIRITC